MRPRMYERDAVQIFTTFGPVGASIRRSGQTLSLTIRIGENYFLTRFESVVVASLGENEGNL